MEFRQDSELKLLSRFEPTHAWVLEPGDMLYLPPGTAMPERIHGAFVSDEEVRSVAERLVPEVDAFGPADLNVTARAAWLEVLPARPTAFWVRP